MRNVLLTMAVLALAGARIHATPPAKLGLPNSPGMEVNVPSPQPRSFPISPAPVDSFPQGELPVIEIAAPSLAPPLGAAPGARGEVAPVRMTPGYPASFPPPTNISGKLPPGAQFISGALPAGGLPPGAMLPGSLPPAGFPYDKTAPGLGVIRSPLNAAPGLDSIQQVHGTGPCGPIDKCLGRKEYSENPLTENLSVFFGLDGAHEPIDLGINARMGYRLHINWGLPLVEDWKLGLHLGAGYNHGNNAVRVLRSVEASSDIHQNFFTIGVFQRRESGVNWELAWDYRNDNYYENFSTSQWRGLLSYYVSERNEIGFWGTYRDRIDRGNLGPVWFNVKPINQVNLFWRHTWDMQIATGFWAGIAEEHGRLLAVAPGESAVQHPFVFGADMFVPLSDSLAIFGEAQFITPNDTGTVIATLGIAWYPGGRPASQGRSPFAPLLPTANNASFSLDAQQ